MKNKFFYKFAELPVELQYFGVYSGGHGIPVASSEGQHRPNGDNILGFDPVHDVARFVLNVPFINFV